MIPWQDKKCCPPLGYIHKCKCLFYISCIISVRKNYTFWIRSCSGSITDTGIIILTHQINNLNKFGIITFKIFISHFLEISHKNFVVLIATFRIQYNYLFEIFELLFNGVDFIKVVPRYDHPFCFRMVKSEFKFGTLFQQNG